MAHVFSRRSLLPIPGAGRWSAQAFPAHGLDKDTQVQDAAAEYQEAVRAVRIFHAQGEVLFGFFHQAVTKVTGGDKFSILPKKGELLMPKSMLIVGSSTLITGRASGLSISAMVSADIELFQTDHGTNVAGQILRWLFSFPYP